MHIDETTTSNTVGGFASTIVFAQRGARGESRTVVGRNTTQNSFRNSSRELIGFAVGKLDIPAIALIHISFTN